MNGHMPSADGSAVADERTGAHRVPLELFALLALLLLAAAVVTLALTGTVDVLKGVGLGDGAGTAGDQKEFQGLSSAIDALRGPATAAVAGVGSLGVAAGGVMIGAGSPKGMRILGCGAGALAAIGAGNGVIA